jgi:mannitol-1-phosphate 5-dehydrogenase
MPVLVQLGAGNIGRGFIAPTFAAAGWKVVFAEVDRARVLALRQRGRYRVIECDGASRREVEVAPVTAVDATDTAAVVGALVGADLVATAVGLAALPKLAPAIAAALVVRLERGGRPLDVLVCENGAHATESLREAVLERVPAEQRAAADAALGTIRASIGRMIPASTGGDPLDIEVEPYACLPVERTAFRGPVPSVPNLDARADFDLVLGQKLYLHNLTHACLAYAGHRRGLALIADCAADAELAAAARRAGDEAAEALARVYGRDDHERAGIRDENADLLDELFTRYRNPALRDPVARVARDPFRKLAADDRLVGAARLCLRAGVAPVDILEHVLDACAYVPAADEPDAQRWTALRARGPLALLAAATVLPLEDPFMKAAALADRRTQAAKAMRAAGLVLTATEEAALEIADFGLGRFEEFGLAIHVYVNTSRCCAKELMILPNQCCPEHRHPPLEGEPGKEETFRVRSGEMDLFLPGQVDAAGREYALRRLPADKRGAVTVYRRVHLKPGDQCTLQPNTPHWFVAGAQGCVVSEFSTRSRDEADIFTDVEIRRVPVPA